jgi:hypothetical protein
MKMNQLPHNGTETSDAISERRARMDGYTIVRAILQSKLKREIRDLAELEQAIQEELAKEPSMIAPWHNSVVLQSACREGMRLAALEFEREHRDGRSLKRQERAGGCRDMGAQENIESEIIDALGRGVSLELSERSRQHLNSCAECRGKLPLWKEAMRLCREDQEFDEMIGAAQAGDPAILRKDISGGLALYGSRSGLVLIVNPEDWMDIRAVQKDVAPEGFHSMV